MTKVQKHHVGVHVEKNAFIDEGDGVVTFRNGLPITDSSEQRNGTKYDIKSMDLSEYKGQVTADHVDKLENIIAKVEGIEKKGNKVVVKSIRYAINENPLARLAYNLLVNGFSTDFSIETYGPWPTDEDMTYYNAKLIGLSQVVVGNNKGAAVNSVVHNSLEQSKKDGLDVTDLEESLKQEFNITANHITEDEEAEEKPEAQPSSETEEIEETEETVVEESEEVVKTPEDEEQQVVTEVEEIEEVAEEEEAPAEPKGKQKQENNNKNKETDEMKFVTIKNSRDFAVAVAFKNAAGEEVTSDLEAGKSVDVSEDQKEAVEAQISGAEAPKVDVSEEVEKAVNSVKADFAAQFAELKAAFNARAEEPTFKPADAEKTENEFAKLDYTVRHGKQINAAWEALKLNSIEAGQTLREINKVNLDALKTAGKVENSLSLSDFGNFVISPELLTDIQGFRNDYTALIDRTDWRETNSLEFAWLRRSGDIDMQNVDLEPGVDGDGNLKPISQYSAEPVVSKLEELAAVTPVCNSATRFLAVDLLGDVAKGYRNDYDRKRAQLVVARLQQAVAANPAHSIDYTVEPTVESLTTWVQLWAKVAETTINGVFIFNMSTYATIQKAAVEAGASGPLSSIFTTGDIPMIFGRPYIIVPNDILPALGSGQTVTVTVDGANVVIDHAVFYFDLSNFTGRTSGGLQYDLSTEASYEQSGVVKSAYQRNELVLRGSFFRGGAILDDTRVAGMTSDLPVQAS